MLWFGEFEQTEEPDRPGVNSLGLEEEENQFEGVRT
jgi:hypothetical protein